MGIFDRIRAGSVTSPIGPATGGGGGGGGTVTSVDVSVPAFLTSTGGPITASGTIALSLATQANNLVFAGPTTGGPLAPTFRALVAADIPALSYQAPGNYITALTGDVTASGPGSAAATIATNVVTNAKLAQMAANTFKANNTVATANATDITGTQATALLDVFTTSLKGLAPASGGGTTNFLRADGTWAAPTAAAPTGTANTVAYFDGSGNLSSSTSYALTVSTFSFRLSTGVGSATSNGFSSFAIGRQDNAGAAVISSGAASFAQGYATGAAGSIESQDAGTFAGGYTGGGKILSQNTGSFAFGNCDTNAANRIRATTGGAVAMGSTNFGGIIDASSNGAIALGTAGGGSGALLSSSNTGAHAFGYADGSTPTAISATALGSGARGHSQNGGIVRAITGAGSWASGRALSGSSLVSSSGVGAHAFGSANSGGQISSSGIGSFAAGQVVSSGQISATSDGSVAMGIASTGTINSLDQGSFAIGIASGSSSSLSATSAGTAAMGMGFNGGQISAGNNGSMARGYASGASALIQANSNGGNFASGRAVTGATISSQGLGSHAMGYADGTSSILRASGAGSISYGSTDTAGVILASGSGSIAGGRISTATENITASGLGSGAFGKRHNVSGDFSTAFGIGHTVSTYSAFVVGQFADATGTAASSVATEIAFAVGIGVAGTPANAFSVGKNADLKVYRTITAPATTGDQTINRPSGTVNFAAASSTLTVTNSLVTANSIVLAVVRTNDTTAVLKNVVPAAGSFVINLEAAATAETSVGFLVLN